MEAYVFLTVHGPFFAWIFWVFYREDKERQISAVRTIPDAKPSAATETPSEEAASEDVQGQRG